MPTGRQLLTSRALDALLIAAVVGYTLAIRVHGITRHFQLLGDQIRDWSIALKPFRDLPLVGPPRVDGGYSWGPIFYWFLWLARVVIGPFVQNLPHAGGLALAAAQSCADGILCFGIRRCSGSWAFAVGATLFIASSPFDLGLSSVIWNPVLAVALAKTATGLILLWQDVLTRRRRAVLFVLAWLTVQAHTPGLPFALAVAGWVLLTQARLGARAAAEALAEALLVVVVLQIPYAAARVASSGGTSWITADSLRHPHVLSAYDGFVQSFEHIALRPWQFEHTALALIVAAIVLALRFGPLSAPVAASVLPLAACVATMSVLQQGTDSYWFLTVVPAGILTALWPVRALPAYGLREFATAALLILAVICQAPRIRDTASFFRLPAYGALVQSSRDLARRGEPLVRIEAPFLPPTADPEFVFRILGGQIRPDAGLIAILSPTGEITYVH